MQLKKSGGGGWSGLDYVILLSQGGWFGLDWEGVKNTKKLLRNIKYVNDPLLPQADYSIKNFQYLLNTGQCIRQSIYPKNIYVQE